MKERQNIILLPCSKTSENWLSSSPIGTGVYLLTFKIKLFAQRYLRCQVLWCKKWHTSNKYFTKFIIVRLILILILINVFGIKYIKNSWPTAWLSCPVCSEIILSPFIRCLIDLDTVKRTQSSDKPQLPLVPIKFRHRNQEVFLQFFSSSQISDKNIYSIKRARS